MFCENCGHKINDGDVFCEQCGHKIVNPSEFPPEDSLQEETTPSEEPFEEPSEEVAVDETEEIPEENLRDSYVASDGVFNAYDETSTDNNVDDLQSQEAQQFDEEFDNVVSDVSNSESNDSNIYSEKAVSSGGNGNVKTLHINKKALISVCVAVAVLAIGLLGGLKIYNSTPIVVNMSDYVGSEIFTDEDYETYWENQGQDDYSEGDGEYSYDESDEGLNFSTNSIGAGLSVGGYNGFAFVSGTASDVVDWDRVIEDVNNQLQKKKKVNGRKLNFYDFVTSYDNFSFSIDKTDDISNGDTISVSMNQYSYEIGGITVDFEGYTYDYEIEGLKEVKVFDPFDYAHVLRYNPVNGEASIKPRVDTEINEKIESAPEFSVVYYDDQTISVMKDNAIIAKINFYFDDDTASRSDFHNGETVTMYYSIDNDDLTDDYNLYIAKDTREFTIDNLGEYATMSTKFTKDQLSDFKKYAVKELKSYLNDDEADTLKYAKTYLVDLKDKDSSGRRNSLCVIYSYKYTWFDEVKTEYAVVGFDNIIIRADGSIIFSPEDYYSYKYSGYNEVDEYVNLNYADDYNITAVG